MKLLRNKYRSQHPNTVNAAEQWLGNLGVKFIEVWMYVGEGKFLPFNHVDDPETLDETIIDGMRRHRARYALHPYHGGWRLVGGKAVNTMRYYDTREAAEMVAIHGV